MARNTRDVSFASFNLLNLQLPGLPWRGAARYTQKQYDEKLDWSAEMLRHLDADIMAFQELWSPQCLLDLVARAGQDHRYELAFLREEGWYDIAVAAAVRPPWKVLAKTIHKDFPPGFVLRKRRVTRDGGNEDQDDDIEVMIDIFSRSIVQLTIGHESAREVPAMEVFCVHLKSKLPTPLDAQERNEPGVRAHATALGAAISTIRRTAESAALRIILNEVMAGSDVPVVVLGDYNDSPNSNTLGIVTERPSFRFFADSLSGRRSDRGLYIAGALQQLRSFRDVHYTHIYDGEYDSLDHVLVSEQFYDHSDKRIWSFREMRVWNDHLGPEKTHPASDHGLVCARFDYNPAG
jgi:endonuclease/exonuclease/phosphatase family metal-dependent hydrolase